MLNSQERKLLSEIASAGEIPLTDTDWELLNGIGLVRAIPETQKQRWNEINHGLGRGVVQLSANGYAFVPVNRIEERFGKTLRGNYPEANETFLRFATTYWTLKCWVADNVESDWETEPMGKVCLAAIEDSLGSIFFPFPTPGAVKLSPDQREDAQRRLMTKFDAPIDVEEFMRGNPILIRDRQREAGGGGGGCAVALMTLPAALIQSALGRFGV